MMALTLREVLFWLFANHNGLLEATATTLDDAILLLLSLDYATVKENTEKREKSFQKQCVHSFG